ncbi:MAG: hypothetical protein JST40_03695 [Armatimonadetes bacterium]|nr:hypothetical protein [Armatimonadota bacterium]
MNAQLKEEPITRTRPTPVRRSTTTRTVTRSVVRSKDAPRRQSAWIPNALAWCLLCFVVYTVSTLCAHVKLESARRSRLQMAGITRTTEREVSLLREELARLNSMGSVDRWAVARGYQSEAPVQVGERETQNVAFNR